MEYIALFERDKWIACNGIRYDLTGKSVNLVYPMCRLMLDAGLPDGAVQFYDDRGVHCMTVHSFHALCATKVTDKPEQFTATKQPVPIPRAWYDALTAVLSGGKDVLAKVRPSTVSAFRTLGYVDDSGDVTEDGLDAMAQRETLCPASEAPDAEPEIQLPKFITPKQREAFEIVHAGETDKWEVLHGKTTNTMIREGWVEMDGSRPVLTAKGLHVARTFEIIQDAA